MQKKFGALRAIGTILKVFGVIEMILAFAGMVAIIVFSSVMGDSLTFGQYFVNMGGSGMLIGITVGVLFFVITFAGAIATYAVGELIYLFISMEENTRATAILLQTQGKLQHQE